ncbi:hypothetical protein BRADI_5g01616v3 [Brachypodium distachyon]|uniref:Uncharacterized protein n=1 Tax=Brachypodium distachyon TaxID=15368 RepID=A0A2K2CEV6_BRADI|nr:hypothetical protein BRADI_5g01616v3 [Brachypodium distachyon]
MDRPNWAGPSPPCAPARARAPARSSSSAVCKRVAPNAGRRHPAPDLPPRPL